MSCWSWGRRCCGGWCDGPHLPPGLFRTVGSRCAARPRLRYCNGYRVYSVTLLCKCPVRGRKRIFMEDSQSCPMLTWGQGGERPFTERQRWPACSLGGACWCASTTCPEPPQCVSVRGSHLWHLSSGRKHTASCRPRTGGKAEERVKDPSGAEAACCNLSPRRAPHLQTERQPCCLAGTASG